MTLTQHCAKSMKQMKIWQRHHSGMTIGKMTFRRNGAAYIGQMTFQLDGAMVIEQITSR